MKILPDAKLAVKNTRNKITVYDLGEVYIAQDRIGEIACLTPAKAPELMAFFNKAWLNVDEIIRLLELELVDAKQIVNKRKSVILLDVCESLFKEKGIKGSQDLRQAVIDNDEEYLCLLNTQNSIEAAVSFLKGKQKGIEMGYNSVRKIIGESTYNMRNGSNNTGNVEDIRNQFGKTEE